VNNVIHEPQYRIALIVIDCNIIVDIIGYCMLHIMLSMSALNPIVSPATIIQTLHHPLGVLLCLHLLNV
jgi:hypothetical protein